MTREQKKVDHTNIFDSWLAQDVFVADILEKIANDWKKANRMEFNRENFQDFVFDDLPCWLENGLQEFLDEEFGEEEDD